MGVTYKKHLNKKWRAMITYKKITYFLGYYENEIDAAYAVDKKYLELGAIHKMNFNKDTNKINFCTLVVDTLQTDCKPNEDYVADKDTNGCLIHSCVAKETFSFSVFFEKYKTESYVISIFIVIITIIGVILMTNSSGGIIK